MAKKHKRRVKSVSQDPKNRTSKPCLRKDSGTKKNHGFHLTLAIMSVLLGIASIYLNFYLAAGDEQEDWKQARGANMLLTHPYLEHISLDYQGGLKFFLGRIEKKTSTEDDVAYLLANLKMATSYKGEAFLKLAIGFHYFHANAWEQADHHLQESISIDEELFLARKFLLATIEKEIDAFPKVHSKTCTEKSHAVCGKPLKLLERHYRIQKFLQSRQSGLLKPRQGLWQEPALFQTLAVNPLKYAFYSQPGQDQSSMPRPFPIQVDAHSKERAPPDLNSTLFSYSTNFDQKQPLKKTEDFMLLENQKWASWTDKIQLKLSSQEDRSIPKLIFNKPDPLREFQESHLAIYQKITTDLPANILMKIKTRSALLVRKRQISNGDQAWNGALLKPRKVNQASTFPALNAESRSGIIRKFFNQSKKEDFSALTTLRRPFLKKVGRSGDIQTVRDNILRNRKIIVSIGIDDYPEHTIWQDLRYARSDASKISILFHKLRYQAHLLQNMEASWEGLRKLISDVSIGSREQDHLVIYFAGHGMTDTDGQRHILLPRADGIEAVSMSTLQSQWKSHLGKVDVIMDTCFTHFPSPGKMDKGFEAFPSSNWYFASSIGESAFESTAEGGGHFTSALLKAMKSPDIGIQSIHDPVNFTEYMDVIQCFLEPMTPTQEQTPEFLKGAIKPQGDPMVAIPNNWSVPIKTRRFPTYWEERI